MEQKHIQHLYNRAGFGISYKNLNSLKSKSKKDIVANLFSDSKKSSPLNIDLTEFETLKQKSRKELRKEFGEASLEKLKRRSRLKVDELNSIWIEKLATNDSVLREKMTLFWANVFVCRDRNIFHIYQYNSQLRKFSLGDFRNFTKTISKEPSMIKYLNLKQNVKKKPNENFARELMELFTLGVGNYNEADIKESARAFTGYNFIRKGNFNGDDIIDIILEKKQCARFICTKVYTYFINPEVDKKRLEEITNVFYKDYNISNLMNYIFNSNWFYDDKNIGVKIKSPLELFVGIQTIIPIELENKKRLRYLQKMMGQTLLFPPNVSGWKGGKNWIDCNTLMFRMKLPALLLNNAVINLEEKGNFEDSFEEYYKKTKKKHKYIKTVVNWDEFEKSYGDLSSKELQSFLISSKIDGDTQNLLDNLKIESNKEFCIQLMSIPEYQLC